MAGVVTAKKDHLSHEMGMHTEGSASAAPSSAFSTLPRTDGGYRLSGCRRMSISTSVPRSTAKALRPADQQPAARSDQARRRHDRSEESWLEAFDRGRHPQPPQPLHRRLLRLFRLRPARRAECSHQGPRRLGLRREHAGRHHPDREERRLAIRRGDARRRSGLPGLGRRAHRHRPEGRHDHCRRRHRLVLPAS